VDEYCLALLTKVETNCQPYEKPSQIDSTPEPPDLRNTRTISNRAHSSDGLEQLGCVWANSN